MAITSQQSTAGAPLRRDVRNLLNLPPDELAEAMASSGAMNAGPPVIHSAYLKNKYTGLVLPWNSLIAEQRDLMVPCDKDGNTDPAAWQDTVVDMSESDVQNEQEQLYWKARQSVVEQAMDVSGMYDARVRRGEGIPKGENSIEGVMTLDKFYDSPEGKAKKGRKAKEK